VKIPRWLDPWRARREQEEDLARELDTHLAIAVDEQQERGLSHDRARSAAQKQLGNVTLLKEEMREMSGWTWLERLVQDARYALRMMRKNPGFAAITICTLAIGIGANTAVFSVVDHVVFRPFGYQDPEQLVAIHEVVRFTGATRVVPVNLAHFQEWRRNWSAAEDLAVIGGMRMSLTGAGEPERLQTMRVSANLFSLLGVQPQLGRTFALEEDQRGRDHVVLLSDDLWRRRFNADPRVVGRAIALNDERYEIVGVLPPLSFPKISELFPITIATTSLPQLWKPLGAAPQELGSTGDYNFACIARLKPGISVAQARSALNALQERLPQRPPDATLQANLVPLVDQVAGRVRSRFGAHVGSRRRGVADRLRQHSEPAARSNPESAARDGDSSRDRGKPRETHATSVGGEYPDVGRRRHRGSCCRVLGAPGNCLCGTDRFAASERDPR
jgi:hypothetical protein